MRGRRSRFVERCCVTCAAGPNHALLFTAPQRGTDRPPGGYERWGTHRFHHRYRRHRPLSVAPVARMPRVQVRADQDDLVAQLSIGTRNIGDARL